MEENLIMDVFSIIVLLVGTLLFLFVLFALSHDDFVLLRKNISVEQVFNIALLTIGVAMLCARIGYVFLHFKTTYLHPLVFLVFPYFPGLSLIVGMVGGSIFLLLYVSKKKFPTRLLDFFGIATLCAITIGFIMHSLRFLYFEDFFGSFFHVVALYYLFLFFFFVLFLLPMQKRAELKDGSLFLLFLISFSFSSFFIDSAQKENKIIAFLGVEALLSVLFFIGALGLFIRKERLIPRMRKLLK